MEEKNKKYLLILIGILIGGTLIHFYPTLRIMRKELTQLYKYEKSNYQKESNFYDLPRIFQLTKNDEITKKKKILLHRLNPTTEVRSEWKKCYNSWIINNRNCNNNLKMMIWTDQTAEGKINIKIKCNNIIKLKIK